MNTFVKANLFHGSCQKGRVGARQNLWKSRKSLVNPVERQTTSHWSSHLRLHQRFIHLVLFRFSYLSLSHISLSLSTCIYTNTYTIRSYRDHIQTLDVNTKQLVVCQSRKRPWLEMVSEIPIVEHPNLAW